MDILEDLDTSWIENFDKIDDEYKNYYIEDLSFINCFFIFLDLNNSIEKIKTEKILFKNPNILTKDELIGLIKHNNLNQYLLKNILKYNINIKPINLKTYIKNSQQYEFIHNISKIDDICFDKSISMFHDINSLFFLFKQQQTNKINKTRKLITNQVYKYTKKRI